MSKTNNKSNFIHSLKGPERLAPEVVKDIIESRGAKNARKELAKKYGISETRVGRLWVEYYGGGKLSDFKSGIKKPLPTEPINNADITIRHIKTERGEYKVKEPKVEKIDPKKDAKQRAKPTRVYKPVKDLILNESAVDEISDRDAELIAGEIGAGNDNPQLVDIFNRLIESRDRDTAYLYKLAKKGLKYNSDTDYEYNSIEETDDDSTAVYKSKAKTNSQLGLLGSIHEDSSTGQWDSRLYQNSNTPLYPISQFPNPNNPSMVLRNNSSERSQEFSSGSNREYSQTSGIGTRAQPIYSGYREEPSVRGAQQINSNESFRYEQKIPTTQYNSSQGCFQSNNSYNGNQCIPKSEQSNGISRGSGGEPCRTVPGIPWLKIKPY
jgi:hypothetical protein